MVALWGVEVEQRDVENIEHKICLDDEGTVGMGQLLFPRNIRAVRACFFASCHLTTLL
jgi:hypothetical protein